MLSHVVKHSLETGGELLLPGGVTCGETGHHAVLDRLDVAAAITRTGKVLVRCNIPRELRSSIWQQLCS